MIPCANISRAASRLPGVQPKQIKKKEKQHRSSYQPVYPGRQNTIPLPTLPHYMR